MGHTEEVDPNNCQCVCISGTFTWSFFMGRIRRGGKQPRKLQFIYTKE